MPRPITIRSLETVTRGTGEVNISGSIWRILAFGQSRVGRKASRERAHKRGGGHASLARIENNLSPLQEQANLP